MTVTMTSKTYVTLTKHDKHIQKEQGCAEHFNIGMKDIYDINKYIQDKYYIKWCMHDINKDMHTICDINKDKPDINDVNKDMPDRQDPILQ